MNVLVVSNNYPSKAQPNYGAFVYNLMQELAVKNNITIISPLKVHHIFKRKHKTYGEEKCNVKRPVYFSVSNKKLGLINTKQISSYGSQIAVNKAIRELKEEPDLVYAHFLSSATKVLDYTIKYNIPLIVASGESTYNSWRKRPKDIQKKLRDKVSCVICVSQENMDELEELGFDKNKLVLIPNAVDYDAFRPLDKNECKKKLGVPEGKFVIGFIGHFIHRKGPNRVIEAISSLNDPNIELICVGNRGQLKENSFTKTIQPVPNKLLPEVYNAFDIFVLPTLHEGHCNVIEEAKACCIPIVSSKGTSVEDQIDEEIGVLVNPLSIEEIAKAIRELQNNEELRKHMIDNLYKLRGSNSLNARANKINAIMQNYSTVL